MKPNRNVTVTKTQEKHHSKILERAKENKSIERMPICIMYYIVYGEFHVDTMLEFQVSLVCLSV